MRASVHTVTRVVDTCGIYVGGYLSQSVVANRSRESRVWCDCEWCVDVELESEGQSESLARPRACVARGSERPRDPGRAGTSCVL